jgi:hypothetical protein
MGCPHPGVECLVAQITKLLIHYGCLSGLGLKMSLSMELLIYRTRYLCSTIVQVFPEVWHLGHSHMAAIPVGEYR